LCFFLDPNLENNACCETECNFTCICLGNGTCNNQCCDANYSDESDPGPYPIPQNGPIEGWEYPLANDTNPTSGDRHVIAVDTDNCILYELYDSVRLTDGYMCSSSAKWDLTVLNYNRTAAFGMNSVTSADAAGLPIFPGLLRWEEVETGNITHALRFTLDHAQAAYKFPGAHFGPSSDRNYPPYGTRFRLQASFSETNYASNPAALTIVRALKKYGLIFADQGSNMYISGTTNANWTSVIGKFPTHPTSSSFGPRSPRVTS